MKIVSLLFAFLSFMGMFTSAFALDVNKKFGAPTEEEMSMTVYEDDPEATAVILYSSTEAKFEQVGENIGIVYKVKERIKILKPEGVKRGDVSVVFYDPEKQTRDERISRIKAMSYNLEGGKVVSSKMTIDLKHKERINEKYCQVKFSIPNVKVGSVIEYEYERHSDYYFTISDWYAQNQEIPVFYTEYTLVIPAWFNFHVENSGIILLDQDTDVTSFTFSTSKGSLTVQAGVNKFFGSRLPVVRDDDWVYCVEDFMTKVVHDLNWIQFPNSGLRRFTTTWEKVDSVLIEDEDFGKFYKMDNPLAQEQAALHLPDSLSVKERTARLHELLKSCLKWDGNFGIFAEQGRKVLKERTANSATLNFVLRSMLRDAGIQAHPVLMSRRSRGRLPWTHPSGESLNTMCLQVIREDGEPFYVDASAPGCPVGVLPDNLLVERARVIRGANSAEWVDLTHASSGRINSFSTGRLTADGVLEGTRNVDYHDNSAVEFRRRLFTAKDSVEFVQKIANRNNVEIEDYHVDGARGFGSEVKETIRFTRSCENDGERIYLNPFLFAEMESPFKAEERVLPVEFPYAVRERHVIQIDLPEGYEVENLPQSIQAKMNDGGMNCRIKTDLTDRKLNIQINFNRQSMLYPSEYYSSLRDFRGALESKCNEMIVLKKISQ